MSYPSKAPSDVLDYRLDLSAFLAQSGNDAATAVTLTTAPPGLILVHPSQPEAHLTAWLSGGASQTEYVLTWSVSTAGG